MAANLVDLVAQMKPISSDPESYFKPSKKLPKDTLSTLKQLFDFSRQEANISCPLKELVVEGFDDEQIWQQIELQNRPFITDTRKRVKDIKKNSVRLRLLPMHEQSGHNNDNVDDGDENVGVEFVDSTDENDVLDSNNTNNRLLIPASSSEDEKDDIMVQDEDGDDNDRNDDNEQQSSKPGMKNRNKQGKPSGSVVDDKFFKLSEMTEFLDKMDQDFERKRNRKQNDDDDNEFDYFRDIDSNEEDESKDEKEVEESDEEDWNNALGTTSKVIGRDTKKNVKKSGAKRAVELKYNDYFDPPEDEKQESKSNEDDDDEMSSSIDEMDEDNDMNNGDDDYIKDDEELMDDENKDDNKQSLSRHEKEQLKIVKRISQLEKENLTTKPWQMSGEVGSTARPLNSLLEEVLNFDHTTAAAPPITEETTKSLEDIIKQRIKDESWDDVERKQKPVTQPYEYKKKQPLDQEKSKLSLSQIYEQEYLKTTQTKEGPQEEEEEEENESHKEIKELMTKLFVKLDALSNFHFTPKPLKPEVKIVTNTPVITMEEVAPVVASDAMLLAPEETHNKNIELKGDDERTETDRKRERRAKKLKQKLKAKESLKKKKLVNKLNPGLGNKYSKKKALKDLEEESRKSKNISVVKENAEEKSLKSSSAFFARLHEEVKQQVSSKKDSGEKKKKKKESISKFKL